MSNFYGGKQGFSFFIIKSYQVPMEINNNGEISTYNTLEEVLAYEFEADTDVHYNDYILLSDKNNPYMDHTGELYRKGYREFEFVGRIAGPPGGVSDITFIETLEEFESNYNSKKSMVGTDQVIPLENYGKISLIKDSKNEKDMYFCYFNYYSSDEEKWHLYVYINNPSIDFIVDLEIAQKINDYYNFGVEEEENSPFTHKYLIRTSPGNYYDISIEQGNVYKTFYEFKYCVDDTSSGYRYEPKERELIGSVDYNGILTGLNLAYYNKESIQVNNQYVVDNSVRTITLHSEMPQQGDGFIDEVNDIISNLMLDFPNGLGKNPTENNNRELVGKIVVYGDSLRPAISIDGVAILQKKLFGFDYGIKKWYYIGQISSELSSVPKCILFSKPQEENSTLPQEPNYLEKGGLWLKITTIGE